MRQRCLMGALALAAVCAAPSAISAQQDAWLAWTGCWRADGAPADELLCIVPEGGAGVRMITVVSGQPVAESSVLTDGRARQVEREGCTGTERAHWSVDGRRVFLNSDLLCEGGLERKVSGVFAITSREEWISAQAISIGDETATRSVRYRAVETSNLPADILAVMRLNRSARMAARDFARGNVGEADVDEALDNVDANAVEEWLELTGLAHLMPEQLPDEQLPASALVNNYATASSPYNYSTPEVVHVVERPVHVHHTYVTTVYRSCWDPFFTGVAFSVGDGFRFGVAYGSGGCGHRYYYSRYSPWGYDLYGWRFRPTRIVVVRVPSRPRVVIRKISVPHRRSYTARYDDRGQRWDNDRRWDNGRDRGRDERQAVRGSAQPRNPDTRVTRNGYSNGSSPAAATDRRAPQRGNVGSNNSSTTRNPINRTGVTRQPTQPRANAEPRRQAEPRASAEPRRQNESRAQPARSAQPRASAQPQRQSESRAQPVRSQQPRASAEPRRQAEPRISAPSSRQNQSRASAQPRSAEPRQQRASESRPTRQASVARSSSESRGQATSRARQRAGERN